MFLHFCHLNAPRPPAEPRRQPNQALLIAAIALSAGFSTAVGLNSWAWRVLASSRALIEATSPWQNPGLNTARIQSSPGWYAIPNTKLSSVCAAEPSIHATEGCSAVIADWNGGIADLKRNRLLFFGGGHAGYAGNEVYALDLNQLKLLRLTEPSLPPVKCVAALSNPTGPNSRHTYNGLAYIADADEMFVFGGAAFRSSEGCQPSPDPEYVRYGGRMNDTWTLDLASLLWMRRDPTRGKGRPATDFPNLGEGAVADYDPATRKVYIGDTAAWYTYDAKTNTYNQVDSYATFSYVMTGAIDPDRRLFVLFGGGQVRAFDLRHHTLLNWDNETVGCDHIRHASYPGLAYDPVQKKIIGWAGGNTVYAFDPGKKECATLTFPGGPGDQQQNGTLGRFRYFPALGVFALVNDWQQDAYLLRLPATGTTETPTAAATTAAGTAAAQSGKSGLRRGNKNEETKGQDVDTLPSGGDLPPADFSSRCAAPGVLVCEGFDDAAKFQSVISPADGLYPDGAGSYEGRMDRDITASGAGSLRFEIDPHTGANAAGFWREGFGQDFGPHSTFYVQFRFRVSPEMLNQDWGDPSGHTSWKVAIFHFAPKTCGSVEITTTNYYNSGVAYLYTDCGGRAFVTNGGKPPYLRQQGDTPQSGYNCWYGDDAGCFRYVPNTWMTLYYEVSIGDWGQPNSSVQAWVGLPGHPLKHWVNLRNYVLDVDTPGNNYNSIDLLTYMTGKDPTKNHPVAYAWYDELIVSKSPVAPPK
jgi:hypothetical protein